MEKRIRIYEVAKRLGVESKTLIDVLRDMGIPVKNHMTAVEPNVIDKLKKSLAGKRQQQATAKPGDKKPVSKTRPTSEKPKESLKKAAPKTAPKPSAKTAPKQPAKPSQRSTRSPAKQQSTPRTFQKPQYKGGYQPRGGRRGYGGKQGHGRKSQGQAKKQLEAGARRVVIQGETPVRELASLIGVPVAYILRTLMSLGVLININQNVPPDTAVKVAEKLGCIVTVKEPEKTKEQIINDEMEQPDNPEKSVPRPPVVTVMGHVDHGKTSLLDKIRHTQVTTREAGGITQHVGASVVEHNGQKVIFLDTPGHEAFTAMRARGARVTDVAVLVVAADDGIMPQSVEAMNHAKAAGVPIVVAINKMDKPGAKPDRVKQQLSDIGLVPEEWGGDTVAVEVSAMTGEGLDNLLEMILLVSEMQELKADPDRKARGYIIESQVDRGRGPVATALIKSGALRVGDVVITDTTWGKVRAMYDGRGRQLKKAGLSTPVEIIGLEEMAQAGDKFLVVEDEKMAKEVIAKRKIEKRAHEMESTKRMTLDDLMDLQKEEEKNELKIIIKSDVQGSLEAIMQALNNIASGEVSLEIIHTGVGAVIESDVMLAKASDAKILGFNVRPDANARSVADSEHVDIHSYRVIYDLLDDVKVMLKGLLKPKYEEVIVGRAEVRAIFRVPKIGTVAGCYVREGKMTRQSKIRLLRDNAVIYEGKMASLKRFKDDTSEVSQGYECGISLDKYQDIKPGDVIEGFASREVKPV